MKKDACTFICMLALLAGCGNLSKKEEVFSIRVDTGYSERNGKDYIKCWVDDSLAFSGTYRNRFNDMTLDYIEECFGMEAVRMAKGGRDSMKIKVRIISLDSMLYEGKRVIDTTFLYRIDNIPEVVISCRSNCGYLLWDTLRTPDYFQPDFDRVISLE